VLLLIVYWIISGIGLTYWETKKVRSVSLLDVLCMFFIGGFFIPTILILRIIKKLHEIKVKL